MYCKNIERPLKASNISLPPLRMPATRVYDITRQPIVTRFFMTLQAFATPSRSEMFYSIISTYIQITYIIDDWRSSAFEWPPRSPDMTPIDFFLWGHDKAEVYKQVATLAHDMKAGLFLQSFQNISVQNVGKNYKNKRPGIQGEQARVSSDYSNL
ncbi:hypothetical protein HUJ04_012308 [Dendroctonus ponderosae]|nr:hypothetical protein HUJ04_012308 [Dendroctonus ponderosae]